MNLKQRANLGVIWLGFFFSLSLLCLISLLPIIFVVIVMLVGHSQLAFEQGVLVLLMLVPLILFPADVAVVQLMLKFIEKREHNQLWHRFWISWRQEYLQAVQCGIMYTLLLVISAGCVLYYWQRILPLAILFTTIFVLVTLATVYGIALLATRKNTVMADIKSSILLVLLHPIDAIMPWISSVSVSLVTYKLVPLLFWITAPALWGFCLSWFYRRMAQKVSGLANSKGEP